MKQKWLFVIILLPVIGILIYGGFMLSKNVQDPLWVDLELLIKDTSYNYLEDKKPEIDSLFRLIQKDTSYYDINAYDLISSPFPLTMSYEKFEYAVQFFMTNKRMLVQGVTGCGRSSLLDRLAKFVAVNENHIITLYCVPQLEVEYHKQWVGYTDNGVFYKGKLLKFFEAARADSNHNYVMIIDDIDLIYPNTLFGAEIWNEFENSNYDHFIDGYETPITIPNNFYLISTTKAGPSNVIKFNDEHYRRLSPNGVFEIYPDSLEFLLYLRRKFQDEPDEIKFENVRRILYTFIKTNYIICKKVGKGYTLGQWSTIRKSIKPDQYSDFVNKFVMHVNALNPDIVFDEKDVSDVVFSVNNDGELPRTNFFAMTYCYFYESGIFSEASVAIIFLLISSLFGYIVFLRRKNLIRQYVMKVYAVSDDFEKGVINYQKALSKITFIKREIDHLAMKKRINYTESLFIYNLMSDRSQMIAESKNTEDIYNQMFEEFMSDKSISINEYERLKSVIAKSRGKISESYYMELMQKLRDIEPTPN